MLEWLAYQVPWWVWIAAALLVVGLVHRLFGIRNALVAAAVAAAAVFYARARQQGWKDRGERIERDEAKAVKQRKESDAQVDQMDDASRAREWRKWLRDGRR